MDTVSLILACAKVPSFSSYEERLHPLIEQLCNDIKGVTVTKVPGNNLIVYIPSKKDMPPVAITAHLDKINHFGEDFPDELPVRIEEERIIGQMDDTAGLGMCLSLLFKSQVHDFPPLYLLFSEMEEGTGLRKHPHLLKNDGAGLYSGMGATKIAKHLIDKGKEPALVITLDTTPLFKGKSGIALYDCFWHRDKTFTPTEQLLEQTEHLKQFFLAQQPDLSISNAVNDYLAYGLTFNKEGEKAIPSIAIEPAIYPYHTKDEGVFCKDVDRIVELLTNFLLKYDFAFLNH